MKLRNNRAPGRALWLLCAAALALLAAALRRWQLRSAFEADTGLTIPGAQASVILICVLVMAGAWLVILALRQPAAQMPEGDGPDRWWEPAFLDAGDMAYPVLMVSAAFLALIAVPVLFVVGVEQFQLYQDMLEAGLQPPSNNGLLTLATAAAAFLAALGLFQTARYGQRPGGGDKRVFFIALPGVAGCIWLMETFRAHAANPVLWDYAPQLLAIVVGMAFYLDLAGMSAGMARPRRLLWMAGMTAVLSAVSMVSAAAELSALSAARLTLCSAQLGDMLLLVSQALAAAAVLWRLPRGLERLPEPAPDGPGTTQEIQEDTRDE